MDTFFFFLIRKGFFFGGGRRFTLLQVVGKMCTKTQMSNKIAGQIPELLKSQLWIERRDRSLLKLTPKK